MGILNPGGNPSAWPGAFWLSLCGLALLGAGDLRAESGYSPVEAGVKASYLWNFAKYTQWPAGAFASSTAPIVIGVLGDDPFGGVLDATLANRSSQGRKVLIRRARGVQALRDCQVVFISRSEQARLPAILATLGQAPVVTVCDADALFEQGVMIKLSLAGETVRFEVKLAPAERAGLKFGSGMLSAAKRIWPK